MNTNTDTPRTDKAQKECGALNGDYLCWYGYMSEHARTLERELAQALRQRDEAVELLKMVLSVADDGAEWELGDRARTFLCSLQPSAESKS